MCWRSEQSSQRKANGSEAYDKMLNLASKRNAIKMELNFSQDWQKNPKI